MPVSTSIGFLMVPDQMQAGVVRVYSGASVAMEITLGQSVRYYTDGWTVPTSTTSTSMATGNYETTYASAMNATTTQLYTGAIPQVTDSTGRQFTYSIRCQFFPHKENLRGGRDV